MIVGRSLVSKNLVDSSIAESTLPVWNEEENYVAGTQVQHEHREYTAIVDTTGKAPANSPDDWLLDGAVNRWACVDYGVSSASEAEDTLWIDVDTSWCDKLYLFDVQAARVEWQIIEIIEHEDEEDERINRESGSRSLVYDNVTNAWEHAYSPVELDRRYSTNIPTYPKAICRITLTRPAETVRLGFAIATQRQEIGTTLLALSRDSITYDEVKGTAQLMVVGARYSRITGTLNIPNLQTTIMYDRLDALLQQVAVFELVSEDAPHLGIWKVLGFLQKHTASWAKTNKVSENLTIIGRM